MGYCSLCGFTLTLPEPKTQFQMTLSDIQAIQKQQKEFFASGTTRNISWRKKQLKKLLAALQTFDAKINAALLADLGKSPFEVLVSETAFVKAELQHILKNLDTWTQPQHVGLSLIKLGVARSKIVMEPFGQCLIIAPWNYPFQLTISPLIGALAAGNTAVLKPSELAPATAQVIADLINATFPENYVTTVQGDVAVSKALLDARWDHIFFTGSTAVGKHVMRAAAENLTPVVLELGGKSPVFVDADAKISLAARRIAWGKFLNAGQTCIAPDYVLVHQAVKTQFLTALQEAFDALSNNGSYFENPDYSRIINEAHFQRLQKMLDMPNAASHHKKIKPAILDLPNDQHPAMQEEIFGPIVPILTVAHATEAMDYITKQEKPLALYVFTENAKTRVLFTKGTSSGSLVFNDLIVHIAHPDLPFGGVGHSGMGNYHGRYSIEAFSHKKPIVTSASWFDIPFRYPPYNIKILKFLRKIF